MAGWRWVRWAALAVVAVLIGVGVTACVLTEDDEPDEVDLAAARQVEARLASLDVRTYGTWAQHSAGAYLDYVANTVKVEPCMAAKGEQFGYPFIDPFDGRPEYTGAGSSWSEPLMSTSSSAQALASARYRWQAERREGGNPDTNWNDKSRSYQRAYGQCRRLRENDPGHPPGSLNLPSDLHWLVSDIEEQFGPTSEYDGCMLEAGYDVYWEDYGGPDAMHQMVEAQAPVMDMAPARLVKTEEWARFLAFEQDVLEADFNCRAHKFADVMAELDAPLAEFENDHADEIDTLVTAWRDIADEAERLGWKR